MRRRAAICAWFRPCISSGCLPLLLSAADAGSCCGAESDARRTGFRRNTIYDLYNEFGVTAVTPINFALSNASTAVRKKCSQLVRTMSQTLGGVAFTSVYGLCGDTFWDDLIDHAEVRDTYRYQEGVRLREGVVFSTLKYGGITFENYRGWIGGGTDAGDTVTPFIDPNEAHFFPLGTPNLFKTFFARPITSRRSIRWDCRVTPRPFRPTTTSPSGWKCRPIPSRSACGRAP